MRWQDKLTKKELKHLRVDANVRTLAAFRRTFEAHEQMRNGEEFRFEPCFECKTIARKLGFLS